MIGRTIKQPEIAMIDPENSGIGIDDIEVIVFFTLLESK